MKQVLSLNAGVFLLVNDGYGLLAKGEKILSFILNMICNIHLRLFNPELNLLCLRLESNTFPLFLKTEAAMLNTFTLE